MEQFVSEEMYFYWSTICIDFEEFSQMLLGIHDINNRGLGH